MAKKKKIDLKRIVADALEYYHNYVKKTIKESTKRQNESLLSEFYRFVDTLPARDKTMKIFSQKGLNRYKEYLIDKMERSKTDGRKRNFGVGQLNRCGAIIALIINRVLVDKDDVIVKVNWNKVDDPRREDQKGHIRLLDDEVAAIENCIGLTPVEEVYRDIFLLQVESGHRVSDLCKILTGKFWIEQGEKLEVIVFLTQKENTKGRVIKTSRVITLIEGLKSQKLIDLNDFERKTKGKGNNTYNEAIRRIAKKAGLDREIVRVNASQIEKRDLLFETISSHDARCTFITKKLIEGWPPDKLCWLTGHTSDDMIKRVYAQLTDKDKLRAIESVLYSNIVEDDSYAETPQQKSDIQKDLPTAAPELSDLDSTSIFESNEFMEFDKYIQGLNKLVDDAINEVFARFPSEYDKTNSLFKKDQEIFKSELEKSDLGSDEKIIELWHRKDSSIIEEGKKNPDYQKFHIDLDRIIYLIAYIDYLKEHHIGGDAIDTLERIFNELCEENPITNKAYQGMMISDIGLPIIRCHYVLGRTCIYLSENRPFADKTDIEDDDMTIRDTPKWDIIYRELQLLPIPMLDTLTQNTKCQPETKKAIFYYVRNGNYDGFENVIKDKESEVRILIRHAYMQLYMRVVVHAYDEMYNIGFNNPDDLSIEKIDLAQDTINSHSPYFFEEEQKPDFIKKGTKEMDYKEWILWLLDGTLAAFDSFKEYAYPSEIKVLNKILSLVDMDQHPELKTAYEEYKAKQNTPSSSINTEEKDSLPKSKKGDEKNEEDGGKGEKKKKGKDDYYIFFRTKNIDLDKLVRLLTEEDDLNDRLPLVSLFQCDNQDSDVNTCLKHFLERASTQLPFKLLWNRGNKVSLKFLIRLLLNTNDKITRDEVIDEGAYDGISDKVSTGQGQGTFWPIVIEAFANCPSSIGVAGIGDSGTKEKNLKELETVADIYFACKK